MSMAEYERIFKNPDFRVSMNECKIKTKWKDFVLQEGMIYGLHRFTVKGKNPERANFAYVYAGKRRRSNGVEQIKLWIRNGSNPESALFDWKSVWIDAQNGFARRLYNMPVKVKICKDYKIDYSIPRNNQLSYTPSGGKSVGALFEYGGYNKGRMKK